ncbi:MULTISPECIES: hypothetical protein [Caproicibacterium]|uniref:Lipoprotein n=1 Tax=Caproicibacterium argilliputei TaxID=3030016 RepID=A0AA97H242_9FIRM|nr:hypothetical protein [Caproicibacterium argilliputei]WOC32355.1 hypothetical protein PXC00_00375 [Caproicibacterium argilliputei]
MNKTRIIIVALATVSAILAGTLAITKQNNQTLAQQNRAAADTNSSLQSDNAALRTRLQRAAQQDAAQTSETGSSESGVDSNTSSAASEPVQVTGQDAEQVAATMVEKYNTYSTNTSAQNQMQAVQDLITDKEKKALTVDTDGAPSKSVSSATTKNPTMTYQSQCQAVYTSSHYVDTQTEYVYVVAQQTLNHSTGSGSTDTASTMLVSAKVVLQNGKWLVDDTKTTLLQNVKAADLKLN